MNILMLTTHFNTGGITQYILLAAKGLLSLGHRVVVVSSGGDAVLDLEHLGATHISVPVKTKCEISFKIFRAVPKLKKIIKEQNIELIHAHTRVTQVLAAFLSWLTGVPYVTTAHGFFKRRWSRRFWPCWGRRVIAISEAVAAHLREEHGVLNRKIILIKNAIDVAMFVPPGPEERAARRKAWGMADHFVIGIIARLSDVKGHEFLIRAMPQILTQIPQARLMIVGQGKTQKSLEALVRSLNLKESVFFYSVVKRTAEILALFDVFVMPSLQEGLGLSIMEAQAMAVPVVASRVGGIPSVVTDRKSGILVAPADVSGLAQAVIELYAQPEFSRILALEGRAQVECQSDLPLMIRDLVKMYVEVIS